MNTMMLGATAPSPVWTRSLQIQRLAAGDTAQRDESLQLSPVPEGFTAVDDADGSIAYKGPSAVAQRLQASGVNLIAIRHGQSQSNLDSEQLGQPLLYGQSESPLTDKGRQQAHDCAAELYRELGGDDFMRACATDPDKIPVFFSSTVSRATDTADILTSFLKERAAAVCSPEDAQRICEHLDVHRDKRLLETNFGQLETHPLSDLQQAYPKFSNDWRPSQGTGTDFRHRFPDGESRADAMKRVQSLFEGIAKVFPHRTVICVTHGETCLAAKAVLGQMPFEDGKVRAQTGTVGNAVPYWLLGAPPVPPLGGRVPPEIPY
jgi:broad specificity phosphatase PhoE